jgi:regulator of sigma E protease
VQTFLYFLLVLGVLIFVHELGHFLVARWYGVRVLTFSLGFGPKILKLDRGGTEYCISLIPLGGYVKMAGETVADERDGAPDEFLSKSKWIRFQVYLAGPAMNVLLAVVVMIGVLSRGANVPEYLTQPPVVGVVQPDSPAERVGIAVGDRILAVNGREMPTWDALSLAVLPKAGQELTINIERAGQRQTLQIVPEAVDKYEMGSLGVLPRLRPEIMEVHPGRPAAAAGLQAGDVVVGIDGRPAPSREDLVGVFKQSPSKQVVLDVERGGQTIQVPVTPEGVEGAAMIGATISTYEVTPTDPTLLEAVPLGITQTWDTAKRIVIDLKGLFTGETKVKQLMGPIAIADLSGTAGSLGPIAILNLMAMISLNLALLNLMPVPVLDGGQMAILLLEGAARRDFSVKLKERFAMVGAALIVALMVTVIYNDIARLMR